MNTEYENIVLLIKNRLIELSNYILSKQFYSEKFTQFIDEEMDEDWCETINENIDSYPYKLKAWNIKFPNSISIM